MVQFSPQSFPSLKDRTSKMVEHISKLRKLQEELHLMENKVSNEDFVMILIKSGDVQAWIEWAWA